MALKKTIFLCIAITITGVACAIVILQWLRGPAPSDVTLDPQYCFKDFAGTVWKTKRQLVLIDTYGDLDLRISTEFNLAEYSRAMADSRYRNGGERVVAVVEPGALVQIDKLVNLGRTSGLLVVRGHLRAGSFVGKELRINEDFVRPNDFSHPGESLPRTWGVASDLLEKP